MSQPELKAAPPLAAPSRLHFPNSALLGYTGFVGSNIARGAHFTHLYNSKNMHLLHGREYELVVCAACPAVKWWANQHPNEDRAAIDSIIAHLRTVRAATFVLISTIDVYSVKEAAEGSRTEAFDCGSVENHAYGANRLYLERAVRDMFPRVFIVRLPALFGPGLKKNYIFDLLTNNRPETINPNTLFQWYPLTRLVHDLKTLLDANTAARKAGRPEVTLVNLFTEPLYTSVFVQAFFSDMVSRVKPLTPDAWPFGPKAADMVYNVRTQHAALFGDAHASYVMSKEEVLVEMGKFIINWRLEAQRSAKGALPRLCVSNIAWADEHEAQVVQVFRQRGVLNVEVAPTRVRSEWKDITAEALDAFGARMRSLGLGIYSFQAVIYNQPDLHLFKDDASREALVQHMRRVIDMLRQLAGDADSGRRIVFGAPKNRLLHGKTAEEATEIAVRVFRELGDYASLNGVCVCLEANPKQYACEFITSAVEAAELVRKVNSPGFMLHLDTACMHLAGDDFRAIIAKNVDILRHVHVSEPNLGNFSAPQCSHAEVCRALLEAKYPYSVCIEMRPSGADSVANVDQAIEFVARAYAPLLAAKP